MTEDLSAAKVLVTTYRDARDAAAPGTDTQGVCANYLAADHAYRGMCPFYDLTGPDAVADTVWSPLKVAMPTLQRRPDIFFAGHRDLAVEHGTWVVEMGNFIGDFTADWLGITATGKATYLPYATLCRV